MDIIMDLGFLLLVEEFIWSLKKYLIISNKIFERIEKCCRAISLLIISYIFYLIWKECINENLKTANEIFVYLGLYIFSMFLSDCSKDYFRGLTDYSELFLVMAACEYLLVI